jgi:ABC-type ATPase involved in cell division
MFTRLKVHNFRAVGPGPVEVELKPLTVFVGENGSGKSSLLEALALTAQSATGDRQYRDLVLDGPKFSWAPGGQGMASRNDIKGLLFKKNESLALQIDIGIGVDEAFIKDMSWSRRPTFLAGAGDPWPPNEVAYAWERIGVERTVWSHVLTVDGFPLLVARDRVTHVSRSGGYSTERRLEVAGKPCERNISNDGVLHCDLFGERLQYEAKVDGEIADQIDHLGDLLREHLAMVHSLSPLRGYGLMHSDAGPDVEFVGSHGEFTIRLLSSIQQKSKTEYERFENWAERFGLPKALAGHVGAGKFKVTFVDRLTHAPLELADAASGAKQGLTMAAQLLLTKPGSTLLLEEPENNLHPRFEKLLPELFAESIRGGHQILAATHSEVLIAAIGNAVRRGLMKASDVIIWHLERTPEGIKAEPVSVSDKGYLDGWIKSFAAVEQELHDEWVQGLPEVGDEGGGGHARPASRGKGGKGRAGK